ncbi:uncharacterized protein BYT42DRAFT_561569 [Radiomyces spectabilis]|uniref:uncharacterized protein n=1 Tax=Radiomyces spectabilis TaxID=64574 RepID=UPI0022205863|nr:uncharacterized protein BYT42DRAFT_561569 [Radiomyces spectabilis]KAI8388870.1 hypothetical protein BYT42DRAFT_561569 [Radiomyces spectabilis]
MQPSVDPLAASQLLETIREELAIQACSNSSALSFIKGFIVGQVSVIVVIIIALRYLLMEDVKRVKKRYIPSRLSTAPPSRANAGVSQLPASYISSKTYYDIVHHPPESTDWLNVLIAQAIMQYREDANINNRLILAVDEVLNGGVRPSFLGPIHVTRLNLGEEFPIFSSARIRSSDELGSMRAEIDFEYNDQITLGIETQVILNWPKQAFAALPVSLGLSVVRFSGTLTIELINPPETTTKPDVPLERYIAISSHSDFVLDLNVRSLIGSRTKLEDIPKLTDLITTKLRNVYIDKLVYPTFVKVKVPNMWEERDRRTREKEASEALAGTTVSDASSGLKSKAKEKMQEFVEDIKEA